MKAPPSIDTTPPAEGREGTLTIAHISDLHFRSSPGDHGAQQCAEVLNFALLGRAIDLVVCTGDLVDNPISVWRPAKNYRDAAAEAKRWLQSLCDALKLNPEKRLVVVPGNHDYRVLGNVSSGFYRRLIGPDDRELFHQYFGEYARSVFLPNHRVAVFAMDSNGDDSAINLASGEMLQEEIKTFLRDTGAFKNSAYAADYAASHKLAALHHHPMPIPPSETVGENKLEPYLLLKNSGSFMREMIRGDVGLILHGHKHHSGLSRASFGSSDGAFRDVWVLAAGALGAADVPTLSCNILSLNRDRTMRIDRIKKDRTIIGGFDDGVCLLDETGKWGRSSRFYSAAGEFKSRYICDEFVYHYNISPNGDAKLYSEYQGLRALQNNDGRMRFSRPFGPNDIEEAQCACPTDSSQRPSRVGQELVFPKPLETDKPLIVTIRENTANVFALDEEGLKASADFAGNDHSIISKVKVSRSMQLSVQFPPALRPRNVVLKVIDGKNKEDSRELKYARQKFFYDGESGLAKLKLDYPIPGHLYSIEWGLAPCTEGLPPRMVHYGSEIVQRTLKSASDASRREAVRRALSGVMLRLREKFYPVEFSRENAEDYEFGIMAYDEESKAMVYSCGLEEDGHAIYTNRWGRFEGIEGLAMRRKGALFIASGDKKFGWHKPCSWRNDYTQVAAIPFFYPTNLTQRPIFLLRLTTRSNTSPLLHLADSAADRDVFLNQHMKRALLDIGDALELDEARLDEAYDS